jgi:bifunctional UDP-N-acetylglucosamine pyrophosphorylase / glucosamine-1-phosphate N-acetyltransferase
VELRPDLYDKIKQLIRKNVNIPNPLTLDIGVEVNIEHISSNGVTIYPGCRIYGDKTVISEGVQIGYEGPAIIDDCQIGQGVELKGGYFNKSVFLERSSMGLGAHVREGCILEEQASGAHCVGLKQTILFPFVTLGSLINFCDCLMAGGRGRKDHSEVGSSYIHFNFTPDGDKTTPSLIGEVPRGVMLNQPAIFLGGQGGIVGPRRIGYGNIVAAGAILRKDILDENRLIYGEGTSGAIIDASPRSYPAISRVVENNILYMANLIALERWYNHVRRPFFEIREFGDLIFAGVIDKLALARKERINRFKDMADRVKVSLEKKSEKKQSDAGKHEFYNNIDGIREVFSQNEAGDESLELQDRFLTRLDRHKKGNEKDYIEFIKGLTAEVSGVGVKWLESIIRELCSKAGNYMPSLHLFKK